MPDNLSYLPPPKKTKRSLDGGRRPPYSGDDGGNDMEARLVRLETLADITERRLTSIETDTKEIRKDIHRLKYWMIVTMAAGIVAVFSVMGGGYVRLDSKIDRLSERIDAKFDKMDAKIDRLDANLDAKFDKIMERLPAPSTK